MDTTVAELLVGDELDAVPRARRFAMRTLAGTRAADDAELVVAELVTNALLHGAAPVVLRLRRIDDGVRVEVEDAGHSLPMPTVHDPAAMTGRGLELVAAVATRWGVDPAGAGGKVVWAELHPPRGHADVHVEEDIERLLEAWTDEEPDERLVTVDVGDVPTGVLIEAKEHIDSLVREFTFEAATAEEGRPEVPPPAELLHLKQTMVHGFSRARAQLKRQAVDAAARGDQVTHLVLSLPTSAADAAEEYLAALEEADRYARTARLLSLEAPPVHRVLRRWYVDVVVARLRAAAAGRPPPVTPTFAERLADEVTELDPLRELAERLVLLQKVTAELTAARDAGEIATVVVGNAVHLLGAHAARVYLLEGEVLRLVAGAGGGDSELDTQYASVPVGEDLPGGVAVRTGHPVVVRNLADLARQFPALAGAYPDERSLLVAPLVLGQRRLGVLALTFRGESREERTQQAFLTTLADVTAQALERASAVSVAATVTERLKFLAEASAVLAEILDYREVLDAVAKLVVPRLADLCVIELSDGERLRSVAAAHADPGMAALAGELAARFPTDMTATVGSPNVVRTGRSEHYPKLTDDVLRAVAADAQHLAILRAVGMSSVLVLPLTGRGGTFGAITMIYAESGRRYDDDDVSFAEDLARRAALAVETALALGQHTTIPTPRTAPPSQRPAAP